MFVYYTAVVYTKDARAAQERESYNRSILGVCMILFLWETGVLGLNSSKLYLVLSSELRKCLLLTELPS